MIDHEGILWVGTGEGLNRYDAQTDTFLHFTNNPGDSTTISNNEVVALYEDRNGVLWVGTGSVYGADKERPERGGLNRMDKNTGKFTRYMHDPQNANSLINNKVSAIFEDRDGVFWIGTAGDGLHTMERAGGTFTRHLYDAAHPERLSRPAISQDYPETDHITFINEDDAGAIWIGTSESGINYYNPQTRKITHYESGEDIEGNFADRTAWTAFSSKDGVLWISTLTGTLYRIDPWRKNIPHYPSSTGWVRAFYEELDGTFWILTDRELIRNNISKGITKREIIDTNPPTIPYNTLKIIREDQQGNVWFGSEDGLFQWDKKKERFIHHNINPNSDYSSSNTVWTIYEDSKANLWIGKVRGLSLLNRETDSATEFLIYPNDTAEVGKNGITSILEDKTGKLWIGTWFGGGLHQFNTDTKTFKIILNNISVSCIFEDSDGVLWVGCWDNLYKYDDRTENFVPYSDPTISSKISVLSMVEDNQKHLWMGTSNNNIVRINPQRNATVVYDKNDGVENGLVFNAAYKDRKGLLYFAGETGYFSFDPEEFTRNVTPPQINFTHFYLGDQVVIPDQDGPLKESLSTANNIRLSHHQNVFSFEFVGIHYLKPEKNQHFCMLENYDTDWRKSNFEKKAYYFNVPPGKYIFRVKAMNSAGIWAEKKIDVTVLPPWWQTWWAYCLYGILFVALIFAVDRIQRERLLKAEKERNRERELLQAKEIEKAYTELKATQSQLIQSEKMASLGELTAGIAHEIQNPLNFVNNFAEVSIEMIDEMKAEMEEGRRQFAKDNPQTGEEKLNLAEEIADDLRQNLEKISHHGKRADSIVKGMLQHSRMSSGQKEPIDINTLADEYLRLSYHGLRAKDKSFNAEFRTDFDLSLPRMEVIPQDIGRVMLNLMNNAFFAVAEKQKNVSDFKPTVTVSTKNHGDWIEISVKDNGNGIPKEIKNKIFQPFFTTKATGQGTGLGLSLSYEIVKAHGGEIIVESQEGEGSDFVIRLPLH
jgi:signal transduction histidine kinase/ligand-binding sensor domain-containing protein